ncbi:Brix domain-containing protein [Syncephalis fuscata]|nr:Brix domain-containing protein [Syncephalis fuscata]
MASAYKSAVKKRGKDTTTENDAVTSASKSPVVRNKQRVLILSTRGINFRQRHLMSDIEVLLPHSKRDAKLDTKHGFDALNELAELNNCNNCLFFEARKKSDLYLWMAKTPNGPTVKFHVQNIHTMDELRMTGNHLKGSRPIVSFDKNFDESPHLRVMKSLLTRIFGVPKGTRKSKPFVDHVISFSIVDGRLWFRNYQIIDKDSEVVSTTIKGEEKKTQLVEVGPRFVLQPIKIFAGGFGGAVVWENPRYISPNQVRAALIQRRAHKYVDKRVQLLEREERSTNTKLPADPVEEVFHA